jgi:hypothetical protein
VRFGALRLDDLPVGAHRRLKGSEVEGLRRGDWSTSADADAPPAQPPPRGRPPGRPKRAHVK